ncbi:hypothetical protein ABZ484_15985 [Streptomyces sp. NPDC006393]|uniref:hypothetical protein n=1 Tax=Streptomyces sp. NPDC006393 TaxID=3156763 RepID=UPI00340CBF91
MSTSLAVKMWTTGPSASATSSGQFAVQARTRDQESHGRDEERQEDVAAGLDATVRKARAEAAKKAAEKSSGTNPARGE